LARVSICIRIALSLRCARLRCTYARLCRPWCICTPARFLAIVHCLPVQDGILVLDVLLVCKLLVADADADSSHNTPTALLERVRHLLLVVERHCHFSLSLDLWRRRVRVFELHVAVGWPCVFGLALYLGRRVVRVDGCTLVHVAVCGFSQTRGGVLDQPPLVECLDFDFVGVGSRGRTVVLVLERQCPRGCVGRGWRIVLVLRNERVRCSSSFVLQGR